MQRSEILTRVFFSPKTILLARTKAFRTSLLVQFRHCIPRRSLHFCTNFRSLLSQKLKQWFPNVFVCARARLAVYTSAMTNEKLIVYSVGMVVVYSSCKWNMPALIP